MRKTALVAVAAVLAFSGIAGAHSPNGKGNDRAVAGPAKQACKAERSTDRAAFKTKYANANGKRAFRRCVRKHVRSAAKSCRTERKADKAAFKVKYSNANGKRAFRRCVRQNSGDAI